MESVGIVCKNNLQVKWLSRFRKASAIIYWKTSFFAFEDAVTELEPKKRGLALRNRFQEGAAVYKRVFHRELLREPTNGANYFKRLLRPHFIEGAPEIHEA